MLQTSLVQSSIDVQNILFRLMNRTIHKKETLDVNMPLFPIALLKEDQGSSAAAIGGGTGAGVAVLVILVVIVVVIVLRRR